MHGQIARALSADDAAGGALAGDVARHAALGGERELAARAFLAAGERALQVFAHADARRLADAGLEHVASLPRAARIPLHVALLGVKVMSAGLSSERRGLATEIGRVVLEAQDAGLHAEAAAGLHALSILQRDGGDSAGAWESTLRAVDVVRRAEPNAKARQLCNTARCLALLEREMPRAAELLTEARSILGDDAEAALHFAWGQGLMDRFRGEADCGRALLERALRLARAAEDHWAECDTLFTLAQLALEAGDGPGALRRCAEVLPVAVRMGEGSEETVARALEALARHLSDDIGPELDRAIARLREVDAKGMLAYALNFAATVDLERRRPESAGERASEALRAAELVQRHTQAAIARALLGRVALAGGDRASAAAQLEALRADLDSPLRVSALARAAALELATALEAKGANEGDRPCRT